MISQANQMNHAFQKNSSAIRSCQILRLLRSLNPIIHLKKERSEPIHMQYPSTQSNSIRFVESLEQPNWEALQKIKQHAISPAEFRTLAEKSFTLWPSHRHTD